VAFKLVKRNKLPVRVKGTLPDDDGKPTDFDFTLNCKRLTQDEIDALASDKVAPIKSFIHNVSEGWDAVIDGQGQPVPFATEQLEEMIAIPGMPMMILQCYLKQVSAVAKN